MFHIPGAKFGAKRKRNVGELRGYYLSKSSRELPERITIEVNEERRPMVAFQFLV